MPPSIRLVEKHPFQSREGGGELQGELDLIPGEIRHVLGLEISCVPFDPCHLRHTKATLQLLCLLGRVKNFMDKLRRHKTTALEICRRKVHRKSGR